jgi:murein DD-endopeptidase MepM/ murein hydrolase activator NlpD
MAMGRPRADNVRVGEIVGRVGNTGSSTEPHLHMHIEDQPSFLADNGVPYEFTEGGASGPVEANVSSRPLRSTSARLDRSGLSGKIIRPKMPGDV